jgi:GT2 family glycosyltransferase
MSSPDIAVVIVTYKSATLTIDCLRSIATTRVQEGLAVRVVVVDNASGDLPAIREAVIGNDWSSWVTLLPASKNGGFAYGNNLGIRCAYEFKKPDFVHLLNPDTQVRRGAIATLISFMNANPQAGIAGGSFETEDSKDWPFAFRFPTLLSELNHGVQIGLLSRLLSKWVVAKTMSRLTEPTDWICGASMMIRPAVLESVGCLDENFFLYFEETEFCHRAGRAGFPTWYVPDSRVMHAIGKSTNVDDRKRYERRLPGYWFESRRRYFAVTNGTGMAALIDVVAILACLLGLLKDTVLRRPRTPFYIRDLITHSILWPRNRRQAPIASYFPRT